MKSERTWGWPIAGYLFLGGLGGGTMIVSSAADLFLGRGEVFALGCFVTAVAIALGSSLLIFELGKPVRFWRVFSTQKAIMTVGAWMLSLLIVTSFVQFTFWLGFSPWRFLVGLRQAFAALNLLLGLGVCTYTGILLGSMKPRRFWNTPALPVLFLVSGLSTGSAFQALLAGAWPSATGAEAVSTAHSMLREVDLVLIALELVSVMVFVLMMRTTAGPAASRAAARWLTGSYALAFWGGVIALGLLLPLTLYAIGVPVLPAACVLGGGLVLRFLVVYSDDRTFLPGEEKYLSRLPRGDEAFLKVAREK
jgi:formate-dependent nitrite reductase membrane component NrfD